MAYPNKLLPKESYRLISNNTINGKGFFIGRKTDDQDILDPVTGLIKTAVVSKQTKYLIGYSINLLGVFRVRDSKIEIRKKARSGFHTSWKPGGKFFRPQKQEYSINKRSGLFFMEFNKVNNFPASILQQSTGVQFQFICKVDHKPTRCNFWHFEIHWENKNNGARVHIDNNKIRGVPKTVASQMRDVIKILAVTNKPRKIKKLSVKIYKGL